MVTSCHGNALLVTWTLWGNSIVKEWFSQKVMQSFDVFYIARLHRRVTSFWCAIAVPDSVFRWLSYCRSMIFPIKIMNTNITHYRQHWNCAVDMSLEYIGVTLQWRHNERDGVSNHRRLQGSGADERKHQSFATLAFVRGIHRWPGNSPHKRPVTRKTFPLDDVIMIKLNQYVQK